MKKDESKETEKRAVVQTAPSKNTAHPFYQLNGYTPLSNCQLELYKALREAVPIIDAAIGKLVRLIGTFKVQCRDESKQKYLDDFLQNVKVNACSQGIYEFLSAYFDQLLTFGTSVGEIVMSPYSRNVCALYNAKLEDIEIKQGDTPLDMLIGKREQNGEITSVNEPQLICVSLLNPEPGSVNGVSILRGLPFVSSILLKIFNSIGVNWERVGNVRFAVTYKPSHESAVNSKQYANEIASEWSKAMRSQGEVCDFVSVGDVGIKVIGADNQILDCDVPVRHILEQIIAKLSIPPFLLGISWSSTERMSSQQADILTSEIEYYRTLLNPVISKICKTYLRFSGYDDGIKIVWDNINLQDETQLAQARLTNAQAQQIENGGDNT